MPSDSKRTISFTVATQEEKDYLNKIASEKGYRTAGIMASVALQQLLTRMKIPFPPEKAITDCDANESGALGSGSGAKMVEMPGSTC